VAESTLHTFLIWLELGLAVPTLIALLWTTAPYGRHVREGWGPTIGSRAGWILMEVPSCLLFAGIYAFGEHALARAPLAMLALWQIHYVHRTFVFPFRMRTKGKRMPLSVPLMGAGFNVLNSYVNARWISHFGTYADSWLTDPRFLIGAAIFFAGMAINVHADTVLIHLRKPGETGYKIPKGGLYRWISSPNYFGEILEWCGWAVLTWSFAGLAFAIYTAANLAPRALANHRWYREKFPDYPPERRALVPFVL
jgi:protein-S-isoprenylcysteine O-methyltransferase Ste14